MTVKNELEKLARTVIDRCNDKTTPFAEIVDALKALTTLYATLSKDKGKSEDDSDGFTMADAQTMIEENGRGSSTVRTNRRRPANHDA
jgi:hypothetical protein